MRAKTEYYKEYVDKRIRLQKLIYLAMILVVFCIVLYDSFFNTLPFHYILFFLLGKLISALLRKTQKATWDENDNKVIIERSIIGLVFFTLVVLLRALLLPRILNHLHIVFISDALFLTAMGWFSGRIQLISWLVEEHAFSGFINNKPTN